MPDAAYRIYQNNITRTASQITANSHPISCSDRVSFRLFPAKYDGIGTNGVVFPHIMDCE